MGGTERRHGRRSTNRPRSRYGIGTWVNDESGAIVTEIMPPLEVRGHWLIEVIGYKGQGISRRWYDCREEAESPHRELVASAESMP